MTALRNSRGMGWVGGCLIVAVVAVVLIGGVGFVGFRKAMSHGAEEITTQFKDHPVILEHIGQIEKLEAETIQSGKLLSEQELEDDWWIWSVQGTKGSGILKIRAPDDPESELLFEVVAGELLMDDKSYDLFPQRAPSQKNEEGSGEPKIEKKSDPVD